MRDYLVFQLYGPMAAWGDIAVGETRRSALHPSKSAVLGMISAALGVDREDELAHTAIASAYGFGAKVLSSGSLLVDYHTVQVPPQKRKVTFRTRKDELANDKLGTLLSSREYRCDAAYLVALWIAQKPAPYNLFELATALEKPKYTPYLGRKSCPLAIWLAPDVKAFETLKDALDSRPGFEKEMAPIERGDRWLYYWEEIPDSGLESKQLIERWDQLHSRQRWQFGPRMENFCVAKKEA